MLNHYLQPTIPVFTLGEIRLLKILYHELSIAELAIFFRRSESGILEIVQELELKKKEVSHS